eukprot:TRINITY_DN11153_c0_g1_i3.p1 TRINITY_DN11153_c0_g1~~TRINITY_DN11153_c0_g1_i3.p1  ORF type:complete len:252 (+),score=30.10 TRINITY_DN11153_c0_g1_i3:302-1057(+)
MGRGRHCHLPIRCGAPWRSRGVSAGAVLGLSVDSAAVWIITPNGFTVYVHGAQWDFDLPSSDASQIQGVSRGSNASISLLRLPPRINSIGTGLAGYLLKRSGYLYHSWKARWVVCDPDERCIRYFSIESPAQPVDVIQLGAGTELMVMSVESKQNVFGVLGSKEHIFCAASIEERNIWMSLIDSLLPPDSDMSDNTSDQDETVIQPSHLWHAVQILEPRLALILQHKALESWVEAWYASCTTTLLRDATCT